MANAKAGRPPRAADYYVLADPELFAWYVTGTDMWWKQVEILNALKTSRRVAVKACNSSSKTKTAAIASLWWVSAYADLVASCITTSSSWGQVEKVIWKEIHGLIFDAARRGYKYPPPLQTDLNMPMGGFIHGMSTNDAVNFHGFHGNRVLFIKDESTGIDAATHEAIDSVASGGHVVQLDLGNPVTTSGPFNALFGNPLVKAITIDAFETPNFIILPDEAEELERRYGRLPGGSVDDEFGRFLTPTEIIAFGDADSSEGGFLDTYAVEPMGGKPRTYLIGRRFAWDVYKIYGIDSPYWQSHVRGQFPDEGADTLIPMSWVDEAVRLDGSSLGMLPFRAGLDVAGPGDDESVLTVMAGPVPVLQQAWSGLTSQRTIHEILAALDQFRANLEFIAVDSVIIGHHLCGALASHGLPVIPVNVGLPPTPGVGQRFANLKAQLYWGLRELFEDTHNHVNGITNTQGIIPPPGIVLPPGVIDDIALKQLSSLRFEENERGQMIMERKKDLRRRGVPSPDRAESLMLANAALIQSRLSRPIQYLLGQPRASKDKPSRWIAAKRAARWDRTAATAARLYNNNK